MTITPRQIVWKRPLAPFALGPNTQSSAPLLPLVPSAVRKILLHRGMPELQGVSPKEEAIALLQLAAETEHLLLVEYLYAAMSVTDEPARKAFKVIAVQEMGHLIGVQNLLLAIGGTDAVHFGRDSVRLTNPESLAPFSLEPVSEASLATYVAIEMPANVPPELEAELEPIRAEAILRRVTPHGVGALYAKLLWLFQPSDAPVPPLNLEPAIPLGLIAGRHLTAGDFVDARVLADYGADAASWLRGSVSDLTLMPVTDAASACALISEIARQGEGLEDEKDSHFEEFLKLYRRLKASQFVPTALPTTPFAATAPPEDAVGKTPIVDSYARAWADLYDKRYTLLIVDLWHAMVTPRTSRTRNDLLGLVYDGMTMQLRELGALLIAQGSAPPFGLGIHSLPNNDVERWRLHARLLDEQDTILAMIEHDEKYADDFDGEIAVANIRSGDAKRRQLIETALTSA